MTGPRGAAAAAATSQPASRQQANSPMGAAPAGMAATPQETARPLFAMGRQCHLEPPRHVPPLTDDHGAVIDRGHFVFVTSFLGHKSSAEQPGPARPAEAYYSVAVFSGVQDMQKGVKRAELTVPEGWLRPKGALATSIEPKFCSLRILFRNAQSKGLQFRIPLFQRRYCWAEQQWQQLRQNCEQLLPCDSGATYSLKRLLTISQSSLGVDSDDNRELVLDGQQRLTTVCVLLAALRDRIRSDVPEEAAQIDELLYLRTGQPILSPTLDDRADFDDALKTQPTALSSASALQPAPLRALVRCRVFFSTWLAPLESKTVQALCSAALDGLHVLHFPVAGSVQMQAVYEKAAEKRKLQVQHERQLATLWVDDELDMLQEDLHQDANKVLNEAEIHGVTGQLHAILTEGRRETLDGDEKLALYRQGRLENGASQHLGVSEQGVEMSEVDLIRNYVHEHFQGEEQQRRVYVEHWLPMERAAASSVRLSVNTNTACEAAFAAALDKLLASHTGGEHSTADGLWCNFQQWWQGNDTVQSSGPEGKIRCFVAAVRAALERGS